MAFLVFNIILSILIFKLKNHVVPLLENFFQRSPVIMRRSVIWMMGWPFGLKLNSNLNRFLGESVLIIIGTWDIFLASFLSIILDNAFYILSAIIVVQPKSFLYVVWVFCFIISFHIFLLHRILKNLFFAIYELSKSLLFLLLGARQNTLKKRTDYYTYETDQVILASFLLIISVFLLPTIMIYFIFASVMRAGFLWTPSILLSFIGYIFNEHVEYIS
eukprot:GHVP01027972.1.p1 GENE.GHVP01027972.1~~GHVP01027972.1.p1  ORF type:complete len:218 (-),score=14.20 GHVP01027972.1:80-733(-)